MQRNNNKPQKREKFNPIIMNKSYKSFNEGLKDLIKLCPNSYLENLFADFEDQLGSVDKISEVDAKYALVDEFARNIPMHGDKDTQFYSLMCSFNKISLKLPMFCTIGWTDIVDKETREVSYKFSFTIMNYKLKTEVYDDMIADGWKEFTR